MAHALRSWKKNLKAWSDAARRGFATAVMIVVTLTPAATAAQERGPTAATPEDIRAAINRLADVDYATRTKAGRLIRRAPAAQAVPLLLQAVNEHGDGYVRYKSLVMLTGFNDPRAADEMLEAMASPNDRLREVAFGYFERHPNPALTPRLLAALEKEQGDFVRPQLVRALAAVGEDAAVRDALLRDITRGVDFFRSTVIEALGDYQRAYAIPRLIETTRTEGPLQDDAILALGRIGDKQVVGVLAELQRTGSRELQPTIAASICLLGVNCSSHIGYLEKVFAFAEDNPGYQPLLRAAAQGLGALAVKGNADALQVLVERGIPSEDPMRAPIALAFAIAALRNTTQTMAFLEKRQDLAAALALLAEGFDMLEEDLEEEQFYVAVRKAFWAAPDNSPTRKLAEQLITKLDF